MTPYELDPGAWQESWDRQQEAYLPDRERRFDQMLDVVDAVTGGAPTVLDLASGTGSISLRVLRRFRHATTTSLDVDPVLQAIARASLDERSTVVTADLRGEAWSTALPRLDYDVALTATALHWLQPDRLTALYREVREVLRPGGVFINADYMPDNGLPGLSERLSDRGNVRRHARYAAGAVLSWEAWWDHILKDPTLGPLVAERRKVFTGDHAADWQPPVNWHLDALRQAGFSEVGLVWRGGADAAVAAVR
jgi:SAM-dependent methyltransferase